MVRMNEYLVEIEKIALRVISVNIVKKLSLGRHELFVELDAEGELKSSGWYEVPVALEEVKAWWFGNSNAGLIHLKKSGFDDREIVDVSTFVDAWDEDGYDMNATIRERGLDGATELIARCAVASEVAAEIDEIFEDVKNEFESFWQTLYQEVGETLKQCIGVVEFVNDLPDGACGSNEPPIGDVIEHSLSVMGYVLKNVKGRGGKAVFRDFDFSADVVSFRQQVRAGVCEKAIDVFVRGSDLDRDEAINDFDHAINVLISQSVSALERAVKDRLHDHIADKARAAKALHAVEKG